MIICRRCRQQNEASRTQCVACGANLLPGRSVRQRLNNLGAAAVALVGTVVLVLVLWRWVLTGGLEAVARWRPFGLPPLGSMLEAFIALIGLSTCGFYLWRTLGPTSRDRRYADRAQRHEDADAAQSEADYAEAIRLAPKCAYNRFRRALFFEKLGRLDEAHKDLLQAKDTEKKDMDVSAEQIDSALETLERKLWEQRRGERASVTVQNAPEQDASPRSA